MNVEIPENSFRGSIAVLHNCAQDSRLSIAVAENTGPLLHLLKNASETEIEAKKKVV